MYRFKNNSFESTGRRQAFTIVEVVAALGLLTLMLSSVMVLMNRYVDAVMDMQLREQAFELARSNMEQLLAESKLSDMAEYGTSETNPDIEWETVVEPFYEPVTDRMWIRAVCSAGFTDTQGEFQNIELEHWITNLTPAQIRQILAQQEIEGEYLKLLQAGELTDIQKTTLAFLEQEQLDVAAYKRFLEAQRREKLNYISQNGMEGWDDFLSELEAKENEFLKDLGLVFDRYNEFAAGYDPALYDVEPVNDDEFGPPDDESLMDDL